MLNITIVTPEDIPVVTQLVNYAYEGDTGSRSWTSEGHLVSGQRTTEESLLNLTQQPAITMLKCSNSGKEIVGFVLLEKKTDTLYLGMLSVSPRIQASGIGGILLDHGERFARQHLYKTVKITVIDLRSELIDWYRRKGFIPTGKLEPFSNQSSSVVVPASLMEMRKELR